MGIPRFLSFVVDLHEVSPEYPVVNAIVTLEDAIDLATETFFLCHSRFLSLWKYLHKTYED